MKTVNIDRWVGEDSRRVIVLESALVWSDEARVIMAAPRNDDWRTPTTPMPQPTSPSWRASAVCMRHLTQQGHESVQTVHTSEPKPTKEDALASLDEVIGKMGGVGWTAEMHLIK